MGSTHLGDWAYEQIHQECAQSYAQYRAALDVRYKAYFEAHPEQAGTHPQLAASFGQAMPPGMEGLASLIPPRARHRHHLSGKSSQALGLGLLGTALRSDLSLQWLEQVLSPVAPFPTTQMPSVSFEYELELQVLNEQPRVTAVDFFVETPGAVICAEIKWAEQGLGRCSCGAGKPQVAHCAARVLERTSYWEVARELFFLPDRASGKPCPISTGYQAIRNVAAARALARERQPVFVLFYDLVNPYFRPTNDWPGWPQVLTDTLHTADTNNLLRFRAIAWQELLPALPLPDEVRQWAAEKHHLG